MLKSLTTYVEAKLGLTIGTDLFAGFVDEPPADYSVIQEGAGNTDVDGAQLRNIPIQVRTVGDDHHETRARAYAIHDLLVNSFGVDIGNGFLLQSITGGTPGYFEMSGQGRHEFSANYLLKVEV